MRELASAVLAEFSISVLAAPVKYRTNFVDRRSDDIMLNFIFKTLIIELALLYNVRKIFKLQSKLYETTKNYL